MNGKGFLIWQLLKLPSASEVVTLLRDVGVNWVSIKIADGEEPYNQTGGNDKTLKAYIETLKAGGLLVGGWQYVYPDRCGPQGARAGERIQKLDLSHLLVDAEREWKSPGLRGEVDRYCRSIEIGKKFPVGLCTYRFPQLHSPFPFKHFLNNDRISFICPQHYWVSAHDPVVQLVESLRQYRMLSDKPFWPIGPTFGWGDWEPTITDLWHFIVECKAMRFQAYGFYSLDWLLSHGRLDWLQAIGEEGGQPPPAEPPAPVYYKVDTYGLNMREEASINASKQGALRAGQIVKYIEEEGDWLKVHYETESYMHKKYLKAI